MIMARCVLSKKCCTIFLFLLFPFPFNAFEVADRIRYSWLSPGCVDVCGTFDEAAGKELSHLRARGYHIIMQKNSIFSAV